VRVLRPTIDSKFHIDFKWWEKQNKDIRVFMRGAPLSRVLRSGGRGTHRPDVDIVDR